MTPNTRWTLAMTVLGLASATAAYLIGGSWSWAIAGLLGSGVVVNALVPARSPRQQRGSKP